MLRLYSYFRSSAAYRVRIALNLKGLAYDILPIHLVREGGENNRPEYLEKNPLGLVPTLETGQGPVIQSLAIMEYLEERYPRPALLPQTPLERARVRALAQTVASEIHPLNNLRVLDYLVDKLGADQRTKRAWYRHWVHQGLTGIERLLAADPHCLPYCHGNQPTLADCCLIPQVYNAIRFRCPLDEFPTILQIAAYCGESAAFRDAAPENQPDAE